MRTIKLENLEISTRVISKILGKLLDVGLQENFLQDSDFELDEAEGEFLGVCFEWLMREGLVHVTNISKSNSGVGFINAVLTSRGFLLMGQKIDISGESRTVADAVHEPAELGGSYSAIGDFLGGVHGGFTKSLSS